MWRKKKNLGETDKARTKNEEEGRCFIVLGICLCFGAVSLSLEKNSFKASSINLEVS